LRSEVISLPWPDLLVLAIVIVSAALAVRRGFADVLLSLIGFVIALVLAFALYQGLASLLSDRLGWTPVWAEPLAFIGLWLLVEMGFAMLRHRLIRSSRLLDSPANRALAIFPGALQGIVMAGVLLTLVAVLPLPGNARRDILDAPLSGKLVQATLAFERPVEGIFGPAARQALGFITVKPPTSPGEESQESIKLNFTVPDAKVEPQTEEAMLELVNKERTSRGLVPLVMDEKLREVARAHADDMFKRGYFAHNTPEGVDPFARMQAAGIVFGTAGENLALAPELNIAHEGLMNSPGHRANILNPSFRKVGIGVLDGGIYGKMFVQEFTD
jgi:uncharacterized protein YkwD/uncharacterized membrane protein required for colicin V production